MERWVGKTARMGFAALGITLAGGSPVAAQARPTTVLSAGPGYAAGWLRTAVLGRHHRPLWTTPVRVGILDLRTFAGGLTPTRRGGGFQTRSLRFEGRDGREYTFRSVDKDPSAVLDSLLRGTVVDALVQDGISAAHPVGALVAAPLLDAVGVLHVEPTLAVLPDDPALGAFRADFGGVLGLIEEHPDETEDPGVTFAGARRVAGTETLLDRLAEGSDDLVDGPAYLKARLMDVFMGDWDRHRDQWRWATFDASVPRRWYPIPRDRDQAFSNFDGLAMDVVRMFIPQFIRFSGDYPDMVRLHWSARELDRRFLSGLDGQVWDSVAAVLQEALTDDVLEGAVRRLPPELQAVAGERFTATLRARRDALNGAARGFYGLLAQDVDVAATDASERIRVDRSAEGWLVVAIYEKDGDEPFFSRRFLASETEEVRLHLNGGPDVVRVSGQDAGVTVRIVAGRDQDTITVGDSDKRVVVYGPEDHVILAGSATPARDTRSFDGWEWSEEDRDQPRDWGDAWLPLFWSGFSSDTGILLGGGARWQSYGFRAAPFASRISARGGYAPSEGKGTVEFLARRNRSNSTVFVEGSVRGSGLEVLHYYGTGNDTPAGDRDGHRVDVTTWVGEARVGVAARDGLETVAGVRFQRSQAGPNDGRYFDTVRDALLGGSGALHDLAVFAGAEWGRGVGPPSDRGAAWGRIEAVASPGILDVAEPYGKGVVDFGLVLTPAPHAPLSWVVRGGAEQVWGRAPWDRMAFLGGASTLRGWAEDRFTGDAAAYASSEVSLRLGYPQLLVPVESGVFAFAEAGRVFVEGKSPGGWHGSWGGGLWLKPFGQPNTLRLGAGRSAEGTQFYGSLGLPWR